MIKFDGRIVQFGFGAVGKSFYEKLNKEIKFDENKYFVITMDKDEFDAYVGFGGLVANFVNCEVTKDNFREVFEKYLDEGDLLIDFADTVGTREICEWCAENNIMYLNTGEADWPENWYSIFNENLLKNEIKKKHNDSKDTNRYPIVLQHGNNPGLVSHFVKAGIEYIVDTQFKKDKKFKKLVSDGKFNEVAKELGIKMIHVNDIDLQEVKDTYKDNTLYSTWCIDSFFFEMLSEATFDMGTHEKVTFENDCNMLDHKNGFVELRSLATDTKCRTYYPNGEFEGFLVPHEETITIAKGLEVVEEGKCIYRPSVMFLYSPCRFARNYLSGAKVNSYPNVDPEKPQDCENENGKTIVRGYVYPEKAEIIYKEKIESGTEYVGVLIIGDNFKPVWVGNRIEQSFLYKDKKTSYWQTPTITPVAMSALAATCWMIKNKERGGIYFPDDIPDYKYILKLAEKYISKTIYKTFEKQTLEETMKIDFTDLQSKDLFC
ncbi:MAG: saccharopine dehydrogenase NADP-binding domain-containing protein [Clostridia bacterium]|nr:saccharopine dehydrogenase NADP-binding domain-containing protein [Clostridia bacterium]